MTTPETRCADCGLKWGLQYPDEPSVQRRDGGAILCNDCHRNRLRPARPAPPTTGEAATKRCEFCGSAKHPIQACPLPGAGAYAAEKARAAADGALREAVREAADELENDPKTRTCYNVAAALRAALSRVPAADGALADLPAMTTLANLIRRSAYHTLRTRGDLDMERTAGLIAVAVTMNAKFPDAMREVLAEVDGPADGALREALGAIATAPKPHGSWEDFALQLQAMADAALSRVPSSVAASEEPNAQA